MMELPKKLMWDRSEDEGILVGGEDKQGNVDLEFIGLIEKDNPELAAAVVRRYNAHDDLVAVCKKAEELLSNIRHFQYQDSSNVPFSFYSVKDELGQAIAAAQDGSG